MTQGLLCWSFICLRKNKINRLLFLKSAQVSIFPGGSEGKASACNTGDLGLYPWVRKIPWRRKWQPTPVLLPGKSHGQRSLVDCSPWDHKESDTTERLHFHFLSFKSQRGSSCFFLTQRRPGVLRFMGSQRVGHD